MGKGSKCMGKGSKMVVVASCGPGLAPAATSDLKDTTMGPGHLSSTVLPSFASGP